MDALKSAGRAIMRSPSLGRHQKLPDLWTDAPDALLEGIIFHLKYLGMTLVEKPKGEDMAAAAIRRIIAMARASAKDLQPVILTVTPHGITLQDAATTQQIEYVSIYRISYCTTDKVQNKVFAYVAQNLSNGALECHAFLSPKKKLAQTVTLTVAQAFTVALDLWQSSKEAGKPDSSPRLHEAAIPPSTGATVPRPDDFDSTAMDGSRVSEGSGPPRVSTGCARRRSGSKVCTSWLLSPSASCQDLEDKEHDDDLDEDFSRLAEVGTQQLGSPEAVT
ncbi:low density lipoprotein receptor adapter protein 1-like isoform X6 [Bufo bufo]|uniref:low density lipoprotein receptor adapter protein 1-like isoform X6 n=1 Tax=Bufo bufo TaxID=8384 RepID=UPI001ABDAADA|nr:low density lipoprotein receptor adapter protein 1-like isoform X6 [Bufo bufo]